MYMFVAGRCLLQNVLTPVLPQLNVGINAWVAHHNTSVFGPDADIFRPERWLDAPPEQLSAMEKYFLAFGQGSRTCIGKNISILEITKMIPALVERYDFDLINQELTCKNHWFVKQKNFMVRVKSRAGKV